MIWWLSGSGDYDLVRWLGGMAAQAAAVLRDKRKRWENHFCIFTQFSAKHGWETWSTYFNRNLASQVRDGSLKRRGRTTPQFRSVKKGEKVKNLFSSNFKTFSLSVTFFSPSSKHLYLFVSLHLFHSLIDIDPLRKHVTFPIGGNLMGIASQWKISNCLTVIPRLHISLQRQIHLFSSRNVLLQFYFAQYQTDS